MQEVPPDYLTRDGQMQDEELDHGDQSGKSVSSGNDAGPSAMDIDERSDVTLNAAGGEKAAHPAEFYEDDKDNR